MSKTLISIIEVAAIVGLQFIPGVGQAVSAGLASAGIGGVSAAAGLAVATTVAAVSFAVLNSILFQPPKPNSTETSVKTANPPRVQALGRRRLYGAYIFYQTDPDDGRAFDVLAMHDCAVGPIDGVEAAFLGDDRVSDSTQGIIDALDDDTYSKDTVTILYRLGQRVETVYAPVVEYFPDVWKTTHRGDGVMTGMVKWAPVKADDYNTVYGKGQPQLSFVARWLKVYDWRDSSQVLTDPTTWKWSENAVLGYVFYKLVNEGQTPTVPSVIDGVANPAYDAELSSILTAKWNYLFAPTVDYWTAAANDADSGIPLTSFRSIMTKSVDLDDSPRSIQLALTTGLAVGMEIEVTAIQNLNHTETVTVTGISGAVVSFTPKLEHDHDLGSLVTWRATDAHPLTEPRYRTCATWNMTSAHKDNLATIRNCFDGWVSPREDGALVAYSGLYYQPTVSIGPDAIVAYTLDNGIEDENAVNRIILTSVSAEHNYTTPECEPWSDDSDIAYRGRVASQTLENHVPSYTQARRLAKRYLARAMAEFRGTVTTNQLGRVADGQRFINLTISENGVSWFDGPVEITKLTHLQTGLQIEFVSADTNIDAWDPATEEGLPAPVGNTASVGVLDTPTIVSATANFGSDSASGATGVYIDIVASGLDRDDVTWHAQTRTQGNTSWSSATYPDIDSGASVEIQTGFVAADTNIEVQVAYDVGDGRVSDWSATTVVDTTSSHIAPDRATGLAATDGTGQITVAWNNPTSANLASERVYISTGTVFSSATLAGTFTDAAGTASSHPFTLSAGAYHIWVTTVSTTGTEGAPVGPVSATAA